MSTHTFDTALGVPTSKERETQVPQKVPAPTPASPQADKVPAKDAGSTAGGIIAPLRTFKNDLQNIVREKKMSLVHAAALESEKKRPSAVERESVGAGRTRRTFGILFSSGLLFVLGGVALFGVFFIMGERTGVPAQEEFSSLLFSENTVPFPLDGLSALEIKRLLGSAREGGSATLGSITRITPTFSEIDAEGTALVRPATLEEFLQSLGTRVPPALLRALSTDFFFGIHTVDENAPLFVVPVLSYERAFAGMLSWEETLNADLTPVFTQVSDLVLGSGGLPEKRRFEDVVMKNYDVRALKDDSGEIELYYSFPTRSLLVIGESAYSFAEILSRLRAERKL